MKNCMLAICAVIAAACAGCFTMESSKMGLAGLDTKRAYDPSVRAEEHLLVSNYGWYLFNCIPLVCGKARKGATSPWAFFCNEVDETLIQERFTDYAAERGYDVEDIVMFNNEQVLLDVYNIPVPIPYICCYREMQLSGVLVKRPSKADEAARRAREIKREMRALLKSIPEEEQK